MVGKARDVQSLRLTTLPSPSLKCPTALAIELGHLFLEATGMPDYKDSGRYVKVCLYAVPMHKCYFLFPVF